MDAEHPASLWQLWQENPIFAAGGAQLCAELSERYPADRVPPGAVIIRAGEPADYLYVVLAGTVRIFHQAPDGREVTVKLLRAPNLFAEIELFHEIALLEHVAAVDEVLLAKIPAAEYLALLQRQPQVTFEHLRHLAAAFCIAARGERHVFAPLNARIANLLLSYAEFFSAEAEDGDLIAHPLSQQSIAQALGAVRRSVAQVLAEWVKAGWIVKRGEYYAILQHEPLQQLAEPIRDSLCYQVGMPLDHLPGEQGLSRAYLTIERARGSQRGQRKAVGEGVVIGRRPPAGLLLASELVDSRHCRVYRGSTGSRFWVEDLGSLNGTLLNGRPVSRAVLRQGDRLRLGEVELRFEEQYGEPDQGEER